MNEDDAFKFWLGWWIATLLIAFFVGFGCACGHLAPFSKDDLRVAARCKNDLSFVATDTLIVTVRGKP